MISTFENPLFALFADEATAAEFAPERTLARYGAVEAALTRAAAAEGLLEEGAAARVLAAIADFAPDWAAFAADGVRDGLPIPSYTRQIKARLAPTDREAFHLGATSQDIMDSALALTLCAVNARFAERLAAVLAALDGLAERFGAAPLMARTRMQAALPITAGDRIAAWRAPLARQLVRFARVRGDVECVSLAGPVGTGSAWGEAAPRLVARVAADLGLADPGGPWHTGRDGIVTYGAWLSVTAGALGKIGIDVALMAQQGLDEVGLSGGGGSSAMAHKKNPVGAELLVTLARFSAAQEAALQQAMVHEQERSGMAWSLEWLVLPELCIATGCALSGAETLLQGITRLGDPEIA